MDDDRNSQSDDGREFSTPARSWSGTVTALPNGGTEGRERVRPERSAEHEEHLDYLARVSTEGNPPPISPETARQARIAWWAIWAASGTTISVPAACTGPDGVMFYSWDMGQHHLELEIIPDKDAEFFYHDRETGHLWGEDYRIGSPLPPGAAEKIKLLV